MIIGIAGRLGAGKTELSKELQKQDFIKFSFADYLKKLISELYELPIEKLYNSKQKNESLSTQLIWNKTIAKQLFKIADIDYSFDIEDQEFQTIRQAMQYIGTDVLQKYDQAFHVKRTIKNLNVNKYDYVCDDLRFMHELNAIRKIDGKIFYILSPNNLDNISNHSSETSITWVDCEYNLANNLPLEQYKQKFINMIECIKLNKKPYTVDFDNSSTKYAFYNPSDCACWLAGFLCRACVVEYDSQLLQNVLKVKSIDGVDILCSYLKCEYQPKLITSPYIIENLKRWNLGEIYKNTHKDNFEIPDIVKNNKDAIYWWRRGLLNN